MEEISGDIEAWKEVHRQFILAIMLTKDSISMEKEKRRYLLEEINLNVGVDGNLDTNSKWVTKAVSRKQKRKKSDFSNAKKKDAKKAATSKKADSPSVIPPRKRLKISMSKNKEEQPLLPLNPAPNASNEMVMGKDEEQLISSHSTSPYSEVYHTQTEQFELYEYRKASLQLSPQHQEPTNSPQTGYQSSVASYNDHAENTSINPFQTSLESTAQAFVVTNQVASQAFASSFPPSASDTLFEEMLQQQGVDEDEEDAF